jgi:tetratricopeptide (TPR) repeat protein
MVTRPIVWTLLCLAALSLATAALAQGQPPPTDPAAEGYQVTYEYPEPTLWQRFANLIAGCGCCCFWLLVIGSAVYGFSRGSWWGMWFWEIALVRSLAESVGAFWARIASRRRMEEQLRARTANPRDSKARYNLGVVYMEQRRWHRAADELEASIDINPDRADAHYRLAKCYYEMDRIEEALEAVEPCLEMRADHYDGLLLAGECLLRLDRTDEARRIFDRFLAPRRDDVAGWYWRGRVEEQAGNRDEAARWYEGAVQRARRTVGPNRPRDRRIARQARKRMARM